MGIEEKAEVLGEKEAATRRNILQNGYRRKSRGPGRKKKQQKVIFCKRVQKKNKIDNKKQAEVFLTSRCATDLRGMLPLKLCRFYASKFLIISASKTTSVTWFTSI